ncbi:MAG: isoprenyl transferase [Clostridia bacterium]|nr:isoprenyl transferase [Clostridia bacterium]
MSGLREKYGLSADMPCHVAIIMDGNGRWAKRRGLPRAAGHRAGMEALRALIESSSQFGVAALTLYAFSTENWKRPQSEVSALFELLVEYFAREIDELHANGVRIRVIGDVLPLPERSREALALAETKTDKNSGLMLNLAINYGSRAELVRAMRSIAADVEGGALCPGDIDDDLLAGRLYTAGLPELDLVIRTAGEQRLSNFLLYQAAYAELIFTDTYFPDFGEEEYAKCIAEYQRRNRRYGGL